MDATLNDFLNEINEIAPPEKKKTKEEKKDNECDWQECFDDSSGFPYYWHVTTNEVTWEMPDEYKNWLAGSKNEVPKNNLNAVAVKVEPLFPAAVIPPVISSTVYKIKDAVSKISSETRNTVKNTKTKSKPPRTRSSDEEDEKIVLISSYGGDTESEDEDNEAETLPQIRSNTNSNTSSPKPVSKPASDDETVIEQKPPPDLIKPTAGYSLIAGYGDDSEEEEDDEEEVVVPEKVETAHSTLFPIMKPIDVAQFAEVKPSLVIEPDEDIDTKAFQRKRRIAVDLVNVPRRAREDKAVELDTKGFGYKEGGSNFKSTGMAFVKSDTLYPADAVTERVVVNGDVCKETEEAHVTLVEKLRFLSEGKEPVSPVQIMLIQLETLYAALKSGQLNGVYLNQWITETNGELVKLEEDVAPSGWLLQWDRSQKRYYYRNAATDECQWDYPQAAEDDAMDICTTPPPPEVIQEARTPTPPSPPPPPRISEKEERHISSIKDETMLPVIAEGQPLPPGVDIVEQCEKPKEGQPKDLISALDSFYSDIAAIESSVVSPLDHTAQEQTDPIVPSIDSSEPVKKKKKVKMSTGISMKKKGVSKLVEKWKSVQKDLD